MNFEELKETVQKEIENVKNSQQLRQFSNTYLGKKGKIRDLFSELKDLSIDEKKSLGQQINELSLELQNQVDKLETIFKDMERQRADTAAKIDLDLPGEKIETGHLHPITTIRREVEQIFQLMGFEIADGPEVEDEWHNFDALNIPVGHPARDALSLGKTLYLETGEILRSQTSSVQIRYMEKHKPPFAIIVPGRVYRYETTDASHEINFYQMEGFLIDEKVSVANLKAILQRFLNEFFKKEVKIRLRPSYFPFTEPSFEVDMSCTVCDGKGCPACKRSGWVEILGAGVVHPNVIANGGLDPNKWKGLAFGLSLDRPTMMKYKINDIRWFHSGNLKFLKQF
jgi:phenylalanyl-tRNA synthetase alpha chain